MLGHEKAEAILAHAIASNKIFPTWIFTGAFGVGKSTMAHRFAKCLLSGTIPTDNSLNVDENHPVHRLVNSHTHPDFFVLECKQESVSINDVRELLSNVRMTPTLSQWRVAILEGADSFNKNIYNSLLKFLEEPPANTVIILICNHAGTMPKTLLSRASKLHFSSLDESTVRQFLQQRNVEHAEELAHISDGSIGYAVYLSEHNGLEIYEHLLRGFTSEAESKTTLKYVIENALKDEFQIIVNSITRILKIYTDMINGVSASENSREINVLQYLKTDTPDKETQKVMDIISMLNKCESQMLDKNAVIVYVYEKFFS